MLALEIPPNSNCEAVDLRVFHDLTPPQPVSHVRLERQDGHTMWYEVVGWTATGQPCLAVIQKVDDSGEGVAWLLHGGDAGLRFRSTQQPAPWQLSDSHQWGEPFLIIADPEDVRISGAHWTNPEYRAARLAARQARLRSSSFGEASASFLPGSDISPKQVNRIPPQSKPASPAEADEHQESVHG